MQEELRLVLLAYYMLGYNRGVYNTLLAVERTDLPLPPDEEAEREFEDMLAKTGAVAHLEHVQLIRTR